jgi:WD40 repeat protein
VGHGAGVKSVDVNSNGVYILSSADDNTVRVWNVLTGAEVFRFNGHTAFVGGAVFTPDGERVVSGSGDATLRLWDILQGPELYRRIAHTEKINDLQLSADGKTAITISSADLQTILWDVETGEILNRFSNPPAPFVDIAFLSNSQQYMVAYDDPNNPTSEGSTVMWDAETGAELYRLNGYMVEVDGAEQTAFTAHYDNEGVYLVQWQLGESGAEESYRVSIPDFDFIATMAYSPDGQRLLYTTYSTNDIVVYDVANQQELGRLPYEVINGRLMFVPNSPEGNYRVVSVPNDKSFILWDVDNLQMIQQFRGSLGDIQDVAYNPNGQIFTSVSTDGTIRFWDIETGSELYRYTYSKSVDTIVYLPDGRRILTGDSSAMVRMWNAEQLTPTELKEWITNNRYVPVLDCETRQSYRLECP